MASPLDGLLVVDVTSGRRASSSRLVTARKRFRSPAPCRRPASRRPGSAAAGMVADQPQPGSEVS
jgi:hypothetical protein